MALTRKFLTALGIEPEKADEIINANTETIEGLKQERDKYKESAEKLLGVQKELDDLRADVKANYVAKATHEQTVNEYAAYKNSVTAEKSKAAKEAAARKYFEGKKITGKSLEIAMLSSGAQVDALKLKDDGEIEDTSALDGLVNGVLSGLVTTEKKLQAFTPTPPLAGVGAGVQQTRAAQLYQEHYQALYGNAEAQKGNEA